jgi:hypothetical protein
MAAIATVMAAVAAVSMDRASPAHCKHKHMSASRDVHAKGKS